MGVDEYELLLNQVNNLTLRRQNVTAIYLSVNAALTGAMAFLFRDGQLSGLVSQVSVLTLLLSGIVACGLWRKLIIQHSVLIGWWYEQLRALEGTLSGSKKLITKEYEDLYLKKQDKKLVGLTPYETRLTWLFTIIYVLFGVLILLSLVFHLK